MNFYKEGLLEVLGETKMTWSLPKGDGFLPRTSAEELKNLYDREEKAKPKLRLLCAIHRKDGESIDETAKALSMKRRTVHAILSRFSERGIDGKDAIKQTGRPPALTLAQRRALLHRLEKGPKNNASGLWTTKEVREHIAKSFGITYTHVHVWEILTSCGFSLQRPRPRHYKSASEAEKARFKKKLASWHSLTKRRVS